MSFFLEKYKNKNKNKGLTHIKNMATIIVLMYLIIISIGTLLLYLPISRVDHQCLLLDSFFTSTSAVCVTGLTLGDTATTWTLFGQIVILLLFQIGGLGYMTLAVAMFVVMGKNIGLQERIQFKETQGITELGGLKQLAKNMVTYALCVEVIGAILLWIVFACEPTTKGGNPFYLAVFHSVSCFCNAGFDLFGSIFSPDCGLIPLNKNPYLLLTLASLSILGSFGYIAFKDLIIPERKRKRSTQTKIVFTTTITLLTIGTVIFFFSEFNHSMKDLSVWQSILNSFYLSATARSTGMGNVEIGSLSIIAYCTLIFLEIIGGSPSGTAGGIKTTTLAILFASVKSALTKKEDTEIFGRRISSRYVNRAIAIVFFYILISLLATIILGFTESKTVMDPNNALRLQTDVFSTLGTVGLANGLHRSFSFAGKIVFICLMIIGRVGALTVFNVLVFSNKKINRRYPFDDVTIG
ncbi:MAG: Trk family potassium uptake protein [Abditibacteriota bacterium]|nr:Trk family potassium uptake protein [Abditibacteriota bacterium]